MQSWPCHIGLGLETAGLANIGLGLATAGLGYKTASYA